ncbi:YeeE/YedE family protein [Alcaligenes faecalis]|nr:YeeE/YedE family protein [Alcaligenes faecalis]MBX6966140.1 YeeE/YedE family protein [Providencia rettgeri]MBX7031057.1 YeeE/YedE family protein [Alcaligenes faecalis]QFY79739.1 YeeE/YedE family protein [Alcaligenes faecalis]
MAIDWSSFTPWSALFGGALIGLAAAVLVLFNGRVFGISGLLSGTWSGEAGDKGWRWMALLGLAAAPWLYRLAGETVPAVQPQPWMWVVVAGLLVGFGTRLGSGCTSGHGVCGLSRLSPRSLVATLTFMASGFLTVFVLRHLI